MSIANTITYETTYDDVLQDRLDHPTTWKEMADVTMSDVQVYSTSYMSTTPTVTTVTRGTGLVGSTFAETAETMTIDTGRDLGLFVDLADLAQSPWTKPAELFDRIGALLNEFIETNTLAQHGSWTNFGVGDITSGTADDTTQITVSATNIDDIVRGVKRKIRKANGGALMNSNGVGFAWRPEDFEILEAFNQSNGYTSADEALKKGTVEGYHYLGADHYWTNDNATNHVMGGIKKAHKVGILRGTYGQAHTIDFPAGDTNTFLSGKAFYSRVDIGQLTPNTLVGVIQDINVV